MPGTAILALTRRRALRRTAFSASVALLALLASAAPSGAEIIVVIHRPKPAATKPARSRSQRHHASSKKTHHPRATRRHVAAPHKKATPTRAATKPKAAPRRPVGAQPATGATTAVARTALLSTSQVAGLQQWGTRYLAYLGVPAAQASDPRLVFLEQWATLEGTIFVGNEHNPLATSMTGRGARIWNSAGVRSYPTIDIGLQATLATMQQADDQPILQALRNPTATISGLAVALGQSNWTGYGQSSWIEQGYASRVSHLSIKSIGLPQPTVSITGVVASVGGQSLADVCVTAVPTDAVPSALSAPIGEVAAASGTFTIAALPRATYVLEVADCHGTAGQPGPVYYDAGGGPSYASTQRSAATALSSACSMEALCVTEQIALAHAIGFGTPPPAISWQNPAPIVYGTAISSEQLDARSSVPGTFTYVPVAGTVLAAGSRTLQATFRPSGSASAQTTTTTVTIQVDRATPSLSWLAPAPIDAGTALSGAQLDATASAPGTFSYSVRSSAVLAIGAWTVTATFHPADPSTYLSEAVSQTITVVPAAP
ncbi:MAG: Chitin binding protein [Acidimicrobiaceae bacterium]|nr:Chitin binding protein [Acidimicrobiaceae bacterium]